MGTNTFYRFRSVDNLLDSFNELDLQSIFFAPPSSLNDPVEGFKDIYFEGDEILWKNFFNHYLLCLMKWCVDYEIIRDSFAEFFKVVVRFSRFMLLPEPARFPDLDSDLLTL